MLGQMIRRKRNERGLTQARVAAGARISKPYLSTIETGKAKSSPTDKVLAALEEVLGFEEGELRKVAHLARTPTDIRREHQALTTEVWRLRTLLQAGHEDGQNDPKAPREDDRANIVPTLPTGLVPVINEVTAGYPHDFTDLDYPPSVADEYVRCPDVQDAQAFAARVVGDSMAPDYIEGDIVVFAPNTPAKDGDDCFVRFQDGETTFKRVYQDGPETLRIQPLNSRYPAETFNRHEVTGVWPAVFRIQRIRR
jgi:SOS-response transcriptional repressor LexA